MPESIVETSDGVVLIANGVDAILRWDGYATQASVAGVAPPYVDYLIGPAGATSASKPVVAGSGAGAISGTYYAAVRYVDEFGNYSDLSNFSDPITVASVDQFDYTNLPVPTQPTVVRRQILRNTDGQTETFYVDIDTTDLASTSLSSTREDDDLATQEAVPLFDTAERDIANVYGMPPCWKPFMAWHQNRMHFAGVKPYVQGSVRVETGTDTVIGQGTNWVVTLQGRYIYLDGADKPYLIESVDEAAQELTLTENYTGDTVRYATYSIKPASGEDNLVYYSEPNNAEAVPLQNSYAVPQDGDDVTGLMNYSSFLYVLKKRRMYRLTTRNDPIADGRVYLGITRGCINNRCWVVANEVAYMLDEGGVYAFSSDAQGEPVSTPIQDIFRRDSFSQYQINWAASDFFHAVHSPQEEVIRWFVSIGEDLYPRHAITFCFTLKRWSLEEYPMPVPASCLGKASGISGTFAGSREQVYWGSRANRIFGLSYDGLDGVSRDRAVRGKVSGAATQTIATDGFSLNGCTNATIAIVTGRAQGQVRLLVQVDGETGRLDRPWDILPDAGDVFQVGGIPIEFRTRLIRYARTEAKTGRSAEFGYIPVRKSKIPQTIRGLIYHDYDKTAMIAGRRMDKGMSARISTEVDEPGFRIDLTGTGYQLQAFPGGQEGYQDGPKTMAVGFDGIAGPDRVRIQSILLNGVAD